MIYVKLLFFAMGFEATGHLVQMIFTIGWMIKAWALLLFAIIVAFSTSLMVLYQVWAVCISNWPTI